MQDRPSSALPYGTSDFYASLVDRCVQALLDAVGREDIDAILLIGAPTRGETTVVSTPEGRYSLSDIDLACLAKPGSDIARLRGRLADWVARANVELAEECSGVDASVKTRGAAAPVYPLIATFEMLRSPTIVWGDESVLGELPDVPIENVPAWDSLVLLHNRTVEQVLLSRTLATSSTGESRGSRGALADLYASGKFLLDSVTAYLFLDHVVPETYADRVRLFADDTLARPANAELGLALREFLPDMDAWARFKSSGDLADLSGLPGAALSDVTGAASGDLASLASDCFMRYAPCCGVMWRAILGRVVGVDALRLQTKDVVQLYSRLESFPRKGVRTLRTLRSPTGRAGLYSTRRVLQRATFASPRALAYVTAVLTYLSYSEREDTELIGSLLERLHPFRVAADFGRLPIDGRREALLGSFSLFHSSALRGRKVPETR